MLAPGKVMAWALALAACQPDGPAAPTREIAAEPSAAEPSAARSPRRLVTRTLRSTALTLAVAPDGTGQLLLERAGAEPAPIPCDRLTGAWGLWIDDIDDDGNAEAIVALHKPAAFDPTPHNRLHVYGFEDGRCVPAWRGTRLVGRFDGVATDAQDRGAIVAHEWLSPTRRRVARYRWRGFGYTVERVLWEGATSPPAALVGALDFGPSPYPSPPHSSPAPDPLPSTAGDP
jgi:hypothetical protein